MPKMSAGLLWYRFLNALPEIFLVHPGGPFWQKKDVGAWSIPKGELNKDEVPLEAAKREMKEETGIDTEKPGLRSSAFSELTPVQQKGGKMVCAWAVQGDFDASEINCNTFEIEWPPRSGKKKSFPEIDKAGWFTISEAKNKIIPGQLPLIEELEQKFFPKQE
jgi:predicted NUDIX family NTP pyrophosphohydrolase